jgi:anti-sigma factor RsiW
LRRLWKRLFRRRSDRGKKNEHPSVEMLAAYHDDRLPHEKDEEIQEHFVDCPECPEVMLDLDRFTAPEAAEAAHRDLSDTWVDVAWRRLRSRLAVEPSAVAPRPLQWLRSSGTAWSLTALLAPCTLALWLQVDTLAGEKRDLEEPQLNPPLSWVEPLPDVRGEPLPPTEVTIPAGARRFVLILAPAGGPPLPPGRGYLLRIQTWQGQELWWKGGLEKSADGTFVVALGRRFLPAGDYRFQVVAVAGNDEETYEEEFPLRLSYL